MDLRLFTRKNVQLSRCPHCGKVATLRRSRSRNLWEKLLKEIKYSPYYCNSCGWRGKIFNYRFSRKFFQLLLLYIILILATAYIVDKLLRSYFG